MLASLLVRPGLLPAGLALLLASETPGAEVRRPEVVVERLQREIPVRMAAGHVPGLAVAVVDEAGVVWSAGFGRTDDQGGRPVGPDTLFGIQSISKTVTATAVLVAASEGLLDLDRPLSEELPGFRVHSIFEEHPERRLTLRHLLGHTAGLPHEAPVGNNFDGDARDFGAHAKSISDTWLRFPVGSAYAYSNLGVDLAGHLLAVRSGQPFPQCVESRLLAPLGMRRSTFDAGRLLADPDRALGHDAFLGRPPAAVPMVPSGGFFTSAGEMAALVRLHLNRGRVEGRQLVPEEVLRQMYAVPAVSDDEDGGYGLGLARVFTSKGLVFGHGGGGFGFLADAYWYPDIGLGAVVLTNSTDHDLQWRLVREVLESFVDDPGTVYHRRAATLPPPPSRQAPPDPGAGLLRVVGERLASRALPHPEQRATARAALAGDYRVSAFGQGTGVVRVRVGEDGELTVDGRRLVEVAPAVFVAPDGNVLDGRPQRPTWRNVRLERIVLPAWQRLLLGAGLLLFPVSLLLRPLVLRRARPEGLLRTSSILLWTAAGVALALLAALHRFPFFLGGLPRWHPALGPDVKALLLMPPAVALFSAAAAVLLAVAWSRGRAPAAVRWHQAAVVSGAALWLLLFRAWRLL